MEVITIVYMYNNCIYVPVVLKYLPNQETQLASSIDSKDKTQCQKSGQVLRVN